MARYRTGHSWLLKLLVRCCNNLKCIANLIERGAYVVMSNPSHVLCLFSQLALSEDASIFSWKIAEKSNSESDPATLSHISS